MDVVRFAKNQSLLVQWKKLQPVIYYKQQKVEIVFLGEDALKNTAPGNQLKIETYKENRNLRWLQKKKKSKSLGMIK